MSKKSSEALSSTSEELNSFSDDNPISLDEIEDKLYLGNLTAATDVNTLTKYNITHILTIDTCPLPRNILELKQITTKFIQLSDLPKENLLSHFDGTYEFIREAVENGAVIVHCYFGVSRSATVIIAYLMRKHGLTYTEAFKLAKTKRSLVYPNPGFILQLRLYHEMKFVIDKNNTKYKLFRLGMAADKVKKAKILPPDYLDLVKPDPGITQTQPEPNVYRCRKCRRALANGSNLLVHNDLSVENEKENCAKIFFVEPLFWMSGVTQSTQGKLFCPKCNKKVGSFSWVMGCQCPCGAQVAPAFYLCPSKVDWTNVVKNVECTI